MICTLTYLTLFIISIETILLIYREYRRRVTFKKAKQRASHLNKKLLVIGAPNAGFTHSILGSAYTCGDACLDLNGCKCKNSIKSDVLEGLKKMPTNEYIIFESCVLEYIPSNRLTQTQSEIERVGLESYQVRIWPSIYTDLLVSNSNNPIIKLVRDGIKKD